VLMSPLILLQLIAQGIAKRLPGFAVKQHQQVARLT